MGSKLKDNLSNKYYQRRNLLNARPNLVKVLVEDSTDISFWERMLKAACPNKQFDIKPYQDGINRAQSKQLIIKIISEKGGSLYIGCVDCDQDKFLEEVKCPHTGLFYPANYLFHTYTYSVENLFCLPSSLGDAYTTLTSFNSSLDFVELFKMVSQKIFPLVVADLFLRSVGCNDVLNVEKWAHIFPGEKVVKQTMSGKAKNDIVQSIESNVSKYLMVLQRTTAYDDAACKVYEHHLLKMFPFMTADNCILFVYGHEVFNFVMTLFEEQKKIDVETEQHSIFETKGMTSQVKNERVAALKNRQLDIKTVLRSNFAFMQAGFFAFDNIVAELQQALYAEKSK